MASLQEKGKSKYRDLKGIPRLLCLALSLLGIGVSIYYVFGLSISGVAGFVQATYYYLMMALLLPPWFLHCPLTPKASRDKIPWYDLLLAALAFGIPFFFFLAGAKPQEAAWEVSAPLYIRAVSLVLLLIMLEGLRRSWGWLLTGIVTAFAFFPLIASYMPGPLMGLKLPFWRIVTFHAIGPDSLVGIPFRVGMEILIGFMLFSAILQFGGGGRFFINVAMATVGRFRGGAAKACVIASALLGTLNGSAIVNVMTAGPVTIPAMKKSGYPAYYAGAIEACASTGGVIMPPVMGATAFVLAAFLGIPYAKVMIAAAAPSVLYYLGLFIQADAFAAKNRIGSVAAGSVPQLKKTLAEGWVFVVGLAALVLLILLLPNAAQAAYWVTLLLLVLPMVSKKTRLTPRVVMDGLMSFSQDMSMLTAMLSAVGLIIGSLTVSGVALGFTGAVTDVAGDNLILLILLAGAAALILGMGVTITAVYIVVAILVAPAMIQVGLNPLAVHIFVLYVANLSNLTPPVALPTYVAANLAGAPPMKTALQAVRLGLVLFIIPFFFVLEPALILQGPIAGILQHFTTFAVGIILMAGSLESYILGVGAVSRRFAPVFFVGGALLAIPITLFNLVGLGVTGLGIVLALREKLSHKVAATGPQM